MFTIEDEIIAYEKIKEIYEALDALTLEEKNIINDFYFKNKTIDKIAKENNKSYNNIRYKKDKINKKTTIYFGKEYINMSTDDRV